jgi:hypothetical protein
MVRLAAGVDSLEKLITWPREFVFGSTVPGSATSFMPSIIRHDLNPNVRVVHGYDGVATIKLAVERGEADATCGTWETFRTTHAEWLKGDPPFGKVILKARDDREGELKDVPRLSDHFRSDVARRVHEMSDAPSAVGFPYAAPPGLPETRLRALRTGLVATWNDSQFREDANRAGFLVVVQDYKTLEQLYQPVIAASPDLVKSAREILGIK